MDTVKRQSEEYDSWIHDDTVRNLFLSFYFFSVVLPVRRWEVWQRFLDWIICFHLFTNHIHVFDPSKLRTRLTEPNCRCTYLCDRSWATELEWSSSNTLMWFLIRCLSSYQSYKAPSGPWEDGCASWPEELSLPRDPQHCSDLTDAFLLICTIERVIGNPTQAQPLKKISSSPVERSCELRLRSAEVWARWRERRTTI